MIRHVQRYQIKNVCYYLHIEKVGRFLCVCVSFLVISMNYEHNNVCL